MERRGKALEAAFFQKEDARAIEGLRRHSLEDRLGRVTGIQDSAALEFLVRQGIREETLPALLLVPLVVVAWADERTTALERLEIHAQARSLGIEPDSEAHRLLEIWLKQQPEPALLEAWERYAEALAAALDAEQREELRDEVLRHAREVAAADGGVLRLGRRISGAERKMLERLGRAFEGSEGAGEDAPD
jgi:hypothetical protein